MINLDEERLDIKYKRFETPRDILREALPILKELVTDVEVPESALENAFNFVVFLDSLIQEKP